MLNFYILVLIYSIFRSARGLYRVVSTFNWLLDKKLNITTNTTDCDYKFIVLIPVLREQSIIRENFNIFSNLKGDYKLLYITTEKESFEEKEIEKGMPLIASEGESKRNTKEIIQELIDTSKVNNVDIVHYPYTFGVMAHQLNYACQEIIKKEDPSRTFILIYNADSRVSPELILHFKTFLREKSEAKVIQQSALFLDNFNQFRGTARKYFLQAIALLQSRWTLAHELPRFIYQATSRVGRHTEGVYVVGHGLCIRLDVLAKVGYFPTSSLNEDLPLGYKLRLSGETIHPLPLLESAQSPATVKGMFNQYRTWFYGNIAYPQYLLDALSHKEYPKIKAFLWAFKYIVRAVIWWLTSVIWLFLLIYPLIAKRYDLFWIAIGAFFVYAPLTFIIIQHKTNKMSHDLFGLDTEKSRINLITYIMSVPAYLTHSVGPWLASFDVVMNALFDKKINKRKTER